MFIPNKLKSMSVENLLAPIKSFLKCETPQSWIDEAVKPENLSVLLIDHLVCEQLTLVCS